MLEDQELRFATVCRSFELESAHRLRHHEGRCRNLHGHHYRIEVEFLSVINPKTQMATDFFDIIALIEEQVRDLFDHNCMLHKDDPIAHALSNPSGITENMYRRFDIRSLQMDASESVQFVHADNTVGGTRLALMSCEPTAENLAAIWFASLTAALQLYPPAYPMSVRVWETPECSVPLEISRGEAQHQLLTRWKAILESPHDPNLKHEPILERLGRYCSEAQAKGHTPEAFVLGLQQLVQLRGALLHTKREQGLGIALSEVRVNGCKIEPDLADSKIIMKVKTNVQERPEYQSGQVEVDQPGSGEIDQSKDRGREQRSGGQSDAATEGGRASA